MIRRLLVVTVLLTAQIGHTAPTCTGHIINPLTDICWSCMFPITVGNVPITPSSDAPAVPSHDPVVCTCPEPLPRVGISVSFWEPVRVAEVTKTPYCFPTLGGLQMFTTPANHGETHTSRGRATSSFWQVHWFIYPLLSLLNVFSSGLCLNTEGLDVAYMTELDPLWNDDDLTFLINPEAVIFANPLSVSACSADCTTSSFNLPISPLFWCAGCQGSMYPLDGNVAYHKSDVQATTLLTERMIFKLHRELLEWGSIGEEGLCTLYPMPVPNKAQYRLQQVEPVSGMGAFGCNPMGRSTMLYESFREFPVKGKDFAYLIWRKRDCCAG